MSVLGNEEAEGKSNREIELPSIDDKLARLKVFETDLQNDEVSKARQSLRAVFDPRLEWFNSHNIIITYHGSLQYNDPDNLDVDVELIAAGDPLSPEDFKKISNELEKDFTKPGVWPRKNCETNIGNLSIIAIEEGLRQKEDERKSTVKEDSEVYAADDVALIFSSVVLYSEQLPQLKKLQRQVRQLIVGNQWLEEGVVKALDGVIEVRQRRRIASS